ncbi:hypothetical protein PVAP13_9KG065000 [Panicum virgatum]|uniref:F-box domain-containing protein n=1 Tax=Panicum virgatum TaxID=38727 RepID=A0A8T0NAN5_PANVG|nr:hypothetical protein PVAP13_9KG065000 [Panicum virgatum]
MAGLPLTSPSTVASDASTSPWASSLPDDLIRLVASRLLAGDLLDYVRFRAVCAPWRSGTASPRGRGVVDPRFHPRRWQMLPEGDGLYPGHPDLHGYVRFFNLDTGAFVRVRIPLFEDDHRVLDSHCWDRPSRSESRDDNCSRLAKFEKLVKGRQSLPGGEGLHELVRVVHPKVTSGTSGTQRATWR